MKLRRVTALMAKEFVQILRDPSSLLIAFVLPMILLFLFGYGVSLDARQVKISVVVNDSGAEAASLASAFFANPYFTARFSHSIKPAENDILSGRSRGIVVLDSNFSASLHSGPRQATVQVIADGSETNTANYVQNYAQGIISAWLTQQKLRLKHGHAALAGKINYRVVNSESYEGIAADDDEYCCGVLRVHYQNNAKDYGYQRHDDAAGTALPQQSVHIYYLFLIWFLIL